MYTEKFITVVPLNPGESVSSEKGDPIIVFADITSSSEVLNNWIKRFDEFQQLKGREVYAVLPKEFDATMTIERYGSAAAEAIEQKFPQAKSCTFVGYSKGSMDAIATSRVLKKIQPDQIILIDGAASQVYRDIPQESYPEYLMDIYRVVMTTTKIPTAKIDALFAADFIGQLGTMSHDNQIDALCSYIISELAQKEGTEITQLSLIKTTNQIRAARKYDFNFTAADAEFAKKIRIIATAETMKRYGVDKRLGWEQIALKNCKVIEASHTEMLTDPVPAKKTAALVNSWMIPDATQEESKRIAAKFNQLVDAMGTLADAQTPEALVVALGDDALDKYDTLLEQLQVLNLKLLQQKKTARNYMKDLKTQLSPSPSSERLPKAASASTLMHNSVVVRGFSPAPSKSRMSPVPVSPKELRAAGAAFPDDISDASSDSSEESMPGIY